MRLPPRIRPRRRNEPGQGVVEFAVLVPAFMIVLFGMLEFGFAFAHHLTLEYATREGARVGAALANGTKAADGTDIVPCALGAPENVDTLIIAAVQRVITSPGSQVPPGQVAEIRIYKADAAGADTTGLSNRWIPGSGPSVDSVQLQFSPDGASQPWSACGRQKFLTVTGSGTIEPDSIGVSLKYDYNPITPLGTLLKISGAGTLRISDRTIMALNPFQDP